MSKTINLQYLPAQDGVQAVMLPEGSRVVHVHGDSGVGGVFLHVEEPALPGQYATRFFLTHSVRDEIEDYERYVGSVVLGDDHWHVYECVQRPSDGYSFAAPHPDTMPAYYVPGQGANQHE